MSRLVKIDFVAALVNIGLEHVAEEILLMIDHPPDLSNSQLVSKLALLLFTCSSWFTQKLFQNVVFALQLC